jgi:hypothetical protein
MLTSCTTTGNVPVAVPRASPTATSQARSPELILQPVDDPSRLPSVLVGSWLGTAPGVVIPIRFSAHGMSFKRSCGVEGGPWRGRPEGLLAAMPVIMPSVCFGGISDLQHGVPKWFLYTARFAVQGSKVLLQDAAGRTQLVLTRDPHPSLRSPERWAFGGNSEVDVTVNRTLLLGVRPAEWSDLLGTWIDPTDTTSSHVEFRRDGEVYTKQGCNDGGGRWAAGSGALLFVGGAVTLKGCPGIDLTRDAIAAGFDGNRLVLFDRSGNRLHELTRAG